MSYTHKVDKNCEDCGALLVQVTPTRRFCYDCARKRARSEQKTYKTIMPKKDKVVIRGTPIPNPNAKYCKGCVYWHGAYEGYEMCNYIFCKDQRRPCPPGKDCTEKTTGKRRRSKRVDIKVG